MKVIISVLIITICYIFVMTKLEYYRESNLISLTNSQSTSKVSSSSSDSISIDDTFYVEITGQVKNPGKYEVKEFDSLDSLIELAGGLLDTADEEGFDIYYSLSKKDTSIYIPKDNGGNKISINTSDVDTLQILPGIGEATAIKIVEYREENGDFLLLEHLKRVNGIGDSVFNKIKDYIRL
ncbi:MAG: ComEA family DNA-binding protein [Bacilli bacterium]|nr:ComEA family DNA-binding protein [Bacilli bacterium]